MAAFWAGVTLLIVLYEERVLRRTFGAEYEDYCRHVRRWVPRSSPFDNIRTNFALSSRAGGAPEGVWEAGGAERGEGSPATPRR